MPAGARLNLSRSADDRRVRKRLRTVLGTVKAFEKFAHRGMKRRVYLEITEVITIDVNAKRHMARRMPRRMPRRG